MIGFILVCILIGALLAFLLVPVLMIANRQKLKEMDRLVEQYLSYPPSDRPAHRLGILTELDIPKGKVWVGDNAAVEAARDKVNIVLHG